MSERRDPTSLRLRRAVAGDRDSFGWIVAHLEPFVIAQVRLRLGAAARRDEDLRDLVDEVWLATLKKIGDLRAREGRVTPVLLRFLVTTSFNVCNNFLRRAIAERSRHGPARAGPTVAPPTPSIARIAARQAGVPTQASWREISETIGTAIDALPPDRVEVLVLRLVEQRSNAEIAQILGIPRNTVAVRYRRAIAMLRDVLPEAIFADLVLMRRA